MGKLILVIPQWVRYPFKIANFVFNLTVTVNDSAIVTNSYST